MARSVFLTAFRSRWFTLVELVVTITILAVLGTIGFLSFNGFQSSARDTDRVTTIRDIEKGMAAFQAQRGSLPLPDAPSGGVVRTGSINGKTYSHLGVVGKNSAAIARFNGLSVDPLTSSEYPFGVTESRQQYEIAAVLENPQAFRVPWIDTAYADVPAMATVVWNYRGYFRFSSWSEIWIANIPGLIWNNSGSVSLVSTGTYFVADKQMNLPYAFDGNLPQVQNADQIVKAVTGKSTASLLQINITAVQTQSDLSATFSGAVLDSFGWDISKVQAMVTDSKWTLSGSSAVVTSNSCDTMPSILHATFVVWTPSQPAQAWQNTSSWSACYYSCDSGYVSQAGSCVLENCAGTSPSWSTVSNATSFAGGTWSYNATPGLCTYVCNAGYYWNGTVCQSASTGAYVAASWSVSQTPASIGYYVPSSAASSQTPCPANSTTISTGSTSLAACLGNAGYYNCQGGACSAAWAGYYSAALSNARAQCSAGYYGTSATNSSSTCNGACAWGYYCYAGSTSAMQYLCPANSYCPAGSASPISCGAGKTSPAGSSSVWACVSIPNFYDMAWWPKICADQVNCVVLSANNSTSAQCVAQANSHVNHTSSGWNCIQRNPSGQNLECQLCQWSTQMTTNHATWVSALAGVNLAVTDYSTAGYLPGCSGSLCAFVRIKYAGPVTNYCGYTTGANRGSCACTCRDMGYRYYGTDYAQCTCSDTYDKTTGSSDLLDVGGSLYPHPY